MQRLVTLSNFLFGALVLFSQYSVLLFVLVLSFPQELCSLGSFYFKEILVILVLSSFPLAQRPGRRPMERETIIQLKPGVTRAHERVGSFERSHSCRLALSHLLLLFLSFCLLGKLIECRKVALHLPYKRAEASSRWTWRWQLTIHRHFIKFLYF